MSTKFPAAGAITCHKMLGKFCDRLLHLTLECPFNIHNDMKQTNQPSFVRLSNDSLGLFETGEAYLRWRFSVSYCLI